MFVETKKRSWTKTVLWRLIATMNSFTILLAALTDSPLMNAVYMNITGLFVYYVYERMWNRISWGKVRSALVDAEVGVQRKD